MSGIALNATWVAPLQTQWNISNASCVPYSAFLSYLLSGELEAVDNVFPTVPIGVALNFTKAMVPDDWTPQPTPKDLLLWYQDFADGEEVLADDTYESILAVTLGDCGSTICPYLAWNGDADLSGIGMMITYYAAAIFSTLYYIILTPDLFEALGHPFPWISKRNRTRYDTVIAGFRESLQGALDATLLFSISMLVAAITRYAQVRLHPNETYSLYGLMDCVFLSTLSVFPCFVLQSLSHELRRRRIRLFMWLLVLAFAVTVDVLYNENFLEVFTSLDRLESALGTQQEIGQYVWLSSCQSVPLMYALEDTLKAGHVVMLLNCSWWVYYVVAGLGGSRWRPAIQDKAGKMWKWWELARLWLRVGNGLLCLAIMWTFLGLFTVYRTDIAAKAKGKDNDNEWTFGQVLALVTWIPIFVDLAVFYIYGVKEGHAGKMTTKYKVVNNSQQNLLEGKINYQEAHGNEKNAVRYDSFEQERSGSPQPVSRQDSWLED